MENITETILQINYNNPGLIKMTLPCNDELFKNNEILIPLMYPCETSNKNNLSIQRLLPILWTKINSIKVNNIEEKDNIFFYKSNRDTNNNWTENAPHLYIYRKKIYIVLTKYILINMEDFYLNI